MYCSLSSTEQNYFKSMFLGLCNKVFLTAHRVQHQNCGITMKYELRHRRKGTWPIWRHCFSMSLRTKENHENPQQARWSLGRDLNPLPSEYEQMQNYSMAILVKFLSTCLYISIWGNMLNTWTIFFTQFFG